MVGIVCDLPSLVQFADSTKKLLADLESDSDRDYDKGLPLVLDIVNTDEYEERNLGVLASLAQLGLEQGRDYGIRPLPPGVAKSLPHPILRVSKDNPWGLHEDRVCTVDYIKIYLERNKNKILRASNG